ncbi:MAG: DsbA family protein [Pseudomonadales bacterium]
MTDAPRIRFYFSFRSPFAAIAFHRLRRAPQFNDLTIELMPVWPKIIFGGHMDNPTDNYFKLAYIFGDAARQAELAGMSAAPFQRLAARIQLPQDVDYRREKVGVKMPDERWEIPHAALLFAERQGRAWAFGEAVFVRRFGLDDHAAADVQDPEVIAQLADAMGLDGAAAARAHESAEFAERMQRVVADGERDGVFGVPFFVLERDGGREAFWGNDRLEHVLRALTGTRELPVIDAATLTEVQPARL